MNIHDYLIDLEGKDWRKLLAYWNSRVPDDAVPWFANKLGEAFFATKDGSIHRLIVGTGAIEHLAADRDTFARLIDIRENAEAWLRMSLIEACRKAGMQLAPLDCLGFKVPPALFGEYVVSNLQPTNIYSHYSWLSHLAKQDEIYWTGE
jgi:hypothetical protein